MTRHPVVSGGGLCAFCMAFAAVFNSTAAEIKPSPPSDAGSLSAVALPAAIHSVLSVKPALVEGELQPPQELLTAMAAWLSSEFDLPEMLKVPSIVFTTKKQMFGLRYRDGPPTREIARDKAVPEEDLVAIYRPDLATIFLPLGWTGATPADLSILVHELVHHLQNEAGSTFECPQAREQMAFEAQERWLRLFGSELQTDFGIDSLTLFIRTRCLHFD